MNLIVLTASWWLLPVRWIGMLGLPSIGKHLEFSAIGYRC